MNIKYEPAGKYKLYIAIIEKKTTPLFTRICLQESLDLSKMAALLTYDPATYAVSSHSCPPPICPLQPGQPPATKARAGLDGLALHVTTARGGSPDV
jgi:hypothetical protein